MKKNLLLMTIFFLNSCTYSITMVHTQGEATDVVDENADAKATVSPNISIPTGI